MFFLFILSLHQYIQYEDGLGDVWELVKGSLLVFQMVEEEFACEKREHQSWIQTQK